MLKMSGSAVTLLMILSGFVLMGEIVSVLLTGGFVGEVSWCKLKM